MRLSWDLREIEMGLDSGVFYPPSGPGVAWNGLVSLTEDEADSTQNTHYIDGVKQPYRRKAGYFSGSIEAVSYPVSFYDDILLQRRPTSFGLSYRVGSKIHIVYNVLVSPTAVTYRTAYDNPIKWSFTTLPIALHGYNRISHLVIDTSETYPGVVEAFEDILYGSDSTDPRLPMPDEILDFFQSHAALQIIDNGDGTWTAIGPDDVVFMLDSTTFQISWPSVVYIDAVTYTVTSL